ncbi:uncharacterized protein Tco025E_03403 [Trypanosoma conorhini]|uniref:Uncharacterized protein n=1 Tax=Trypanosoma conorhini TaxID=83891 RepID=A0A422PWK5_9TRYP|nr:uncharacterized protein Tco025E_03403 [Trypanosoma conorhini]RNF22135.1 hypothetical protein Tco025E_03403 [Trypanosoma conorhini]
MYFFQAEKQGTYFEGWSMRHFAFDSRRRHMYYTEREKHPHRTPHRSPQCPEAAAPWSPLGEPTMPWKKKFKVSRLVVVSTVHEFHLDDPHLKETDFFTLEVHGRTRALGKEEPPKGPLLLSPFPDAETPSEALERAYRDPFRLSQLYEVLRDQFTALRREQGLRATASTMSVNSQSASSETSQARTLQSPRSASAKEKHIIATIRCRSEEEFRQAWYIVQMVLGFDRLDVRPYRGLPPYDPRNGVPFGHIPMYLWHTFKALEKSVFYVFLRGDLVGRDHEGNVEVSLPDAHLCITHDMVLVMRDNGTIPRWIHLQNINTFEYNTVAKRPFFALLTDDPSPDILFIPKPPEYGPVAIAAFCGAKEVSMVQFVLRDACFASNGIRRVMEFVDANWAASVRAYFNKKEETRHFKFAPLDGFDESFSCLIPKVHLARVWREVLQDQLSRSQDDVAAIPLEGTGGHALLSGTDVNSVRRQLEVERSHSHDEIVGMPLDTLLGRRRERVEASMEGPKLRPDSFGREPAQEVVYQQPGAQYLRPEAAAARLGAEGNVEALVNASFAAMGIAKPQS